MRISSGLSGALQENLYDGITVLGTISEGRFFRVLKARMGTKHIILKSAGHRAQKVPAVTESSHNALKDRLRTEMSVFYIPARDSMFCQQTYFAAGVFKGEYLLHFVHFHDSLPADQRLACEEIFAEQSAVLDSILFSLQSAVRDSILLSLPGAPGR
ncbi:MAG: hypothetical protein MR690_08790 [Rikenellaceae bacterium]|nr:hypothetical protein [Rikenellaceae bacterium]